MLATLCRELAILGLDVGMSDAAPAVSVRRGRTDTRLWVTVGMNGGVFAWCGGDERGTGCTGCDGCDGAPRRHPAADPAGAAKLIAAHVRHR